MAEGDEMDCLDEPSSPPCYIDEADPAYMGLSPVDRAAEGSGLQRWRSAERARLIEARRAIDPNVRKRYDRLIITKAKSFIGQVEGLMIALYWPIKGEPDLRPLAVEIARAGGTTALPVVTAPGLPLAFRFWRRGDPLLRGVWNIPVPNIQAPLVTPDVVIAPVVGFDSACYRLGYGGGYYDRTLVQLPPSTRAMGVGYNAARIGSIYPQSYDIPMDIVITESGLNRSQS